MNINYSESGVLELALQLGFVGVGLIVLMIGRAVFQAVRLLRSPFYRPRVGWFLTIIVLAALTNMDAGWLLATGNLDWVMILIACLGLQAETARVRTEQTAAKCVPELGPPFQQLGEEADAQTRQMGRQMAYRDVTLAGQGKS